MFRRCLLLIVVSVCLASPVSLALEGGDAPPDSLPLRASEATLHGFRCTFGELSWVQYNRCESQSLRRVRDEETPSGREVVLCMGDHVQDATGVEHLPAEGYDPCAVSTCKGWSCADSVTYALVQRYSPYRVKEAGKPNKLAPLTRQVVVDGVEREVLGTPCVCVRRALQGGPRKAVKGHNATQVVIPRGADGFNFVYPLETETSEQVIGSQHEEAATAVDGAETARADGVEQDL